MPDFDRIEDPRDPMMEPAPFRNRETLESDLGRFFAAHMHDISNALPPSAAGAAKRFLGALELPNDREVVQVVGVPGKRDAQRTIDPYYDRVMHCAKRFVKLPDAQQRFVLDNSRSCPWRGDDIAAYVRIVEESERMQETGVEAYKAQAMSHLRAIIAGGAR